MSNRRFLPMTRAFNQKHFFDLRAETAHYCDRNFSNLNKCKGQKKTSQDTLRFYLKFSKTFVILIRKYLFFTRIVYILFLFCIFFFKFYLACFYYNRFYFIVSHLRALPFVSRRKAKATRYANQDTPLLATFHFSASCPMSRRKLS